MTTTMSTPRSASAAPGPSVHVPAFGIHLQPVGGLLVDRLSLYYVRLNGVAVEVALQLARTGSLRRTAEIRAAAVGDPVDRVYDELFTALTAAPLTRAWVDDGLLGRSLRVTGSTDSYLPLLASLQLTNRCNLRCGFCYASSGAAMPGELATADWLKVLERLAAAGLAGVTLTGGEPTLARGFRTILSTASALIDTVDVFTNGLHWSDDLIRMTAACGNVRVQVSVDGTAVHHDRLRGRVGAYDETLRTLHRLADAGVSTLVSMTVSPQNHRDVAAVIRDAHAAGARMFRAGKVVPVGRGDADGYGLTPAHTAAVVEQFHDVADLDIDALAWDGCGDTAEELSGMGLPVEFVTPGYLNWHVRADGGVTPCQVEKASFGHIVREPLSEIGRPHRIESMRTAATGCRCIKRIDIDDEPDLPFGFEPARSPQSGGGCADNAGACCRG